MLLDGMQFSWLSFAMPNILSNTSHIKLTPVQTELISSHYLYGNLFGVIFVWIMNYITRRKSVILSSFPLFIAWLLILTAKTANQLKVARFVGGIGRTVVYIIVPIYIGEITEPQIRGMLGSVPFFMTNVGLLLTFVLTKCHYVVAPIVALLIGTVQFSLIKLLKPSPYQLMQLEMYEEGRNALEQLRCSDNVDEEFSNILIHFYKINNEESLLVKFKRLFTKRRNKKALLILITLRGTQSLCGYHLMNKYVHSVFLSPAGQKNISNSILLYFTFMISSSLLSLILIDLFKRKTLMLWSSSVTSFILFLEGIYYLRLYTKKTVKGVAWFNFFCPIMYVHFYAIGVGTIPVVMSSEIFSVDVKFFGVTFGTIFYMIGYLLSDYLFFSFISYGIHIQCWIFSLVCLLIFTFSLFYVPDTMGKSLEVIQFLLTESRSNIEVPPNSSTDLNRTREEFLHTPW